MTNQEEVELRSKIEALELEITKVPFKSTHDLDEVYFLSCYISNAELETTLSSSRLRFLENMHAVCSLLSF